MVTESAKPICLTIYTYDKTHCDKKVTQDLNTLTQLSAEPTITWLDVQGKCTLDELHTIFSILEIPIPENTLALDAAVAPHFTYSLPKLFQFDGIDYYDEALTENVMSFFLGKNFLLSFHVTPILSLAKIAAQLENPESSFRAAGADYLLYIHLLYLLDTHLTKLHQLGTEVDALEALLVVNPQNFTTDDFFRLRKSFALFRKKLWVQRDIYAQVIALSDPIVPPHLVTGLNHLAIKARDFLELCDNYVDHFNALLDIYYSSLSTQMNRIMKTLTIFSVIFLPLSFLAGIWGMNFRNPKSPWAMPELQAYYGYPAALMTMVIIAVTLLVVFIKTGWLKLGKKG